MIFLVMIIACILGVAVGLNAPIISYTYSSYLAIAIIAALDSVFGGVASVINKKFDMTHEDISVEGPILLIPNHVTSWDPVLVAMSLRNKQVYYVASEHLFRKGFIHF